MRPTVLKEFDNHRWVSFVYDPDVGLECYIAIHRGGLIKPAFGATRFWKYGNELEALRDALRLSKVMSYKSALAGLSYGGAKAVIINQKNGPKKRDLLLETYARQVNYLNGRFITGADAGVNRGDLEAMASQSKYIVGLKADPVKFTNIGVFYSIQECLKEVFGNSSSTGRSFAIQGLGKTGMGILKLIYNDAKKIYVSDINSKQLKMAKDRFPHIEIVKPSDIYKQYVDVFAPCALSNEINSKNVDSFRCKIIVGSANSQLETAKIGELLFRRGILYAPDYVVNAGGLISVVDEYENRRYNEKRIMLKVEKIKSTLESIISKSKRLHKATNLIADEMAEKIFNKFL